MEQDFRAYTGYPLGIRQNNPGNIRKTNTKWQGEVPSATGFEAFQNVVYGLRALMINVHTLYTRDGKNTISKLISAWAPPNENDTKSYVKFVSEFMNVPENKKLVLNRGTYIALAKAIARFENGHAYAGLINENSYLQAYNAMPAEKKNDEPGQQCLATSRDLFIAIRNKQLELNELINQLEKVIDNECTH